MTSVNPFFPTPSSIDDGFLVPYAGWDEDDGQDDVEHVWNQRVWLDQYGFLRDYYEPMSFSSWEEEGGELEFPFEPPPLPAEPEEVDVLELLADKNGGEDSEFWLDKPGFIRNYLLHERGFRRAKTLYKGSSSKSTCGRCIEKRHRHHAERVAVRAQMAHALPCEGGYEDTDVFFDASLENDTYTPYNGAALFGPVLKCVGLNWEEAYHKIASRHPGRKAWDVRSWLHRMMDPHEWPQSYGNGFEVDDDGIVRLKQDQPKAKVVVDDFDQAEAWVGDRRIGQVGSRLFWFGGVAKPVRKPVYQFDWCTVGTTSGRRGRVGSSKARITVVSSTP